MADALRRRLDELRLSLMLLTRLPVGRLAEPLPPMSRAVWALPVAGVIAALPGAAVFWLAMQVLPPVMAALLAIGIGMLVTGGFHEDGLADTADSAGGWTRERKLEIMRDSRIGTYGALALIIAVGLRVSGLATAPTAGQGSVALLAIAAASRALIPAVMAFVPPGRVDGVSAEITEVNRPAWLVSALIGLGVVQVLATPLGAVLVVVICVVFAAWASRKVLGGRTGDTLGATQQLAEVGLWLVLASAWLQ